MRIPKHIGVIPDGNRRWAIKHGLDKEQGYQEGLSPGLELFKLCQKEGVEELTYYGFTADNTKRPKIQRLAFTQACVDSVKMLAKEDASLLVVGDTQSPTFPKSLIPFTIRRQVFGNGGIKVNFLVNYGWQWDLRDYLSLDEREPMITDLIKSRGISRVDLIIRWGGMRRLSGFLPLQSVYSDFYIIDELWPDFQEEHFYRALKWYDKQDITLGG
ncbi:MAG: undecaprenyl diphosphate synthase family protein [Tissierellia bacterium]|nr:undecaprenyl diphosphate synthase family protein [Tissierellia bacterium]